MLEFSDVPRLRRRFRPSVCLRRGGALARHGSSRMNLVSRAASSLARFALLAGLAAVPATAQIQLPGAAQSTGSEIPPANKPKASGPSIERTPSEDSLVGHPLYRNGAQGEIELQKAEAARPAEKKSSDKRERVLLVSRLTLPGELISKPGSACKVELTDTGPLAATSSGRPDGLWRYEVASETCPFAFDVLDGAVLVAPLAKGCTFAAVNCRVEPGGLWGPPASALGEEKSKEIEHSRSRAEAALRANFRALLARTKDPAQVRLVAREQAGFSSDREQTCRDYSGEERHGFCASRITQARAASLGTRLAATPAPVAAAKDSLKKVKPALAPGQPPSQ